jgi:hypothetical protein
VKTNKKSATAADIELIKNGDNQRAGFAKYDG